MVSGWQTDRHRSEDNTIRLWDVESGAETAVLTGHTDGIGHVAWSPDGDLIVTASEDGTARIYDTQTENLLATACDRAVRNLSEDEWARYMGDQPYRETCPGKPVPGRDF